jgi:hypothetical protein
MHLRSITAAVVATLFVALPAVLLSACSTTSSANWLEPRTDNGPFKNVLIIAVLPWDQSRLTVEEQLTYSISTNGTQGHKSIYIEHDLEAEPRTKASLTAMIEATNADAVLVLRATDQEVEASKTQSKLYFNVDGGGYLYGFYGNAWVYEVSRHETEQLLAANITTYVQSTLYDVADKGRPVYRVNVRNKYKDEGDGSVFHISGEVADATAGKLRRAGLIN